MSDRVPPADTVRREDTSAQPLAGTCLPKVRNAWKRSWCGTRGRTAALALSGALATALAPAATPGQGGAPPPATSTPSARAAAPAVAVTPAVPVTSAAPVTPAAPPAPAGGRSPAAGDRAAAETAAGAGQAKLDRAEVPATGRQEAILTITRFGRYSVRAESRQGTAVRVVDRMAGELGAAGEAGHENGRLDLFLDRGDYKIVAESHAKGEGSAKLAVEPFRRSRAAAAETDPQLVERKLVREDLDDLRQVSYWLRLPARQGVRLEAAGRNLSDLRLWRDGSWLEAVEPSCAPIQPVTGQPLLRCEIAAVLPPGLYLVAAYGGVAQPWAEDAREHPFYLRWGYPRLAEAGRRRFLVSPFGEDWFEVPGNVNYARIELPEARPARLTAGWAAMDQLLGGLAGRSQVETAEVKKESVPPVAEVHITAKADSAGAAATGQEQPHQAGGAAEPPPSLGDQEVGVAGVAGGAPAGGEAAGTAGDNPESSGNNGTAGGGGEADTAPPGEASAADAGMPQESGSGDAGSGAGDAASAATGAEATPSVGGEGESPAAQAEAGDGSNASSAGAETAAETAPASAEAGGEEAAAEPAEGAAESGAGEQGGAAATAPRLWLGVRGAPGQPYVLQHFEQRDSYAIVDKGEYWISTVHSGDPRDSVDATAVLTSRRTNGSDRERLEIDAAVPLDSQHAWARRFNFLAPLTLFLAVKERGRYEVISNGGGRFRIEPFFTSRPEHYKEPAFAGSGAHWDLDPGLYELSAVPRQHGIVTLGVRPAGKFPGLLADAGAAGAETYPVQAAVRFAPLTLDPDRRYVLHLSTQPQVEIGGVFRRWPVDLDEALPVAQRPGEPFTLAFTTAEVGIVHAESDDGQLLEAAVDGGPWLTAAPVAAAGQHQVQVRNPAGTPGAHTVTYSLWVEPAALAEAAPLPPLPAGALAALPSFPRLSPGTPHYLDLARGAAATFAVQAGKPGLYEMQTTGVLATGATLRTRTVTSLAAGSANGVGRNALVRQYLREGDFQATVTVLGRSQGHLGVTLETTQLADGGELRPDVAARLTLAAGQGAIYRFTIAQAGDYRLLAMGLGFVFTGRIEDADGWPIAPPNLKTDLSRHFEPGHYRLVLLPQPIASRAVTLLARKPEPARFTGHGPHPLPLGKAVEHLWREPAGDGGEAHERPADLWQFDLPADAHVILSLNAEMEGTLSRLPSPGAAAGPAGGPAGELGRVPPGRSLSIQLAAGRYQLAAVCSRRNSLVRYRVRVATEELVEGEERLLAAPVTLPVAVNGAGLVEISSFAATDVRARLYAADGTLVADEDDRPDDWNFLISERLAAGRYRLEVEPVGRRSATLRLAMRGVAEVTDRPLALPFDHALEIAPDQVRILPLTVPAQADALVVSCRPAGLRSVGLGIEVRQGSGWRLLGSAAGHAPRLAVALPGGDRPAAAGSGEYRLRIWSADQLGGKAVLAGRAGRLPRVSERSLARGAALPLLAGIEPPLAAAVVELSHPGLLRLEVGPAPRATREVASAAAPEGAAWSAAGAAGQLLEATEEPGGARIAALGDRIWLLAEASQGAPRVRGERLTLRPGDAAALSFRLPAPAADASCDLDGKRSAGPLLVMASALAGQPAVQVAERDAAAPRRTATTLAVTPRAAVAVALAPHQPVLKVWDAGASSASAAGSGAARDANSGKTAALQVRVAQLGFAAPVEEPAAWGTSTGSLAGIAARRYALPAGPKRIRLSLGDSQVAVLAAGDTVLSTHWQGGQPFEEVLDDDAGSLTLLHTAAGSDPFTIEILPRPATLPELALDAAAPFVRTFDRAGTVRLRLPAGGAATSGGTAGASVAGREGGEGTGGASRRTYRVWTAGGGQGATAPGGGPEMAQAQLLDGAGGVARAAAVTTGSAVAEVRGAAGGWLLIQHGRGAIMAWTAGILETGSAGASGNNPTANGNPSANTTRSAGEAGGRAWQAPLGIAAQAVKPPAAVALTGRFTHLAITIAQPVVLHVRTATPALTLLRRGGAAPVAAGAVGTPGTPGAATPDIATTESAGPAVPAVGAAAAAETVQVHPDGVRLDAYLAPGVSELGLAPLAEGELGGVAEITTTPVLPASEGLGPEVLLPAGGSRWFSFHVASRRPVGWGAAAAAEQVSSRLLHGDGTPVEPRPLGIGKPAALADLLQMAELDAGDYLLALTSPPDAAPLRVRAVVVGLELPDTGPPPEVIRQYMRDAGATALATANAATPTTAPPGSHP